MSHPNVQPVKRSKFTAKQVADSFKKFLWTYDEFRKDNGLQSFVSDAFEVCTSLSDKNGRICRQVKHAERNDHKPDWPDGMTEAMTGYLIYMIMLLNKYGVSLGDGMQKELESSVQQYGKQVPTDPQ